VAFFCKSVDCLAHGLIIAIIWWNGIMHGTARALNAH
jgi:hypothetical protein